MRWRKKWLKIFSSLYYTNFTAAKVWQENEKNYSVIPMNWPVFPKYHPDNSLSINTLVYLTNIREKLPKLREILLDYKGLPFPGKLVLARRRHRKSLVVSSAPILVCKVNQ